MFCLRQIDLLTLGKDVEQEDRDILPRIEGDDPVAPALAFAASPKPHLACGPCARHDLAGAWVLRDVVHNRDPFRVCQTKRFGITQVGWGFDNCLHEQSVRHCRSHGKTVREPIPRALPISQHGEGEPYGCQNPPERRQVVCVQQPPWPTQGQRIALTTRTRTRYDRHPPRNQTGTYMTSSVFPMA